VTDQELEETGSTPDGDDDGIPVGWYDDPTPSRKPRERLWDGDAWTQWTRQPQEDRVEDEPPGWYHDAERPDQERLWTGSRWTDHRRPARFELEVEPEDIDDEADAPSPFRPTFGVPGWYPDEARPGVQRYWDGEAWTDEERDAPSAPEGAPTPPPPPPSAAVDPPAPPEPAAVDPAPAAPTPAGADGNQTDPVSQLSELARLHDAGALTDAEFGEAKAKVLRRV
jgi:hypothetical protein